MRHELFRLCRTTSTKLSKRSHKSPVRRPHLQDSTNPFDLRAAASLIRDGIWTMMLVEMHSASFSFPFREQIETEFSCRENNVEMHSTFAAEQAEVSTSRTSLHKNAGRRTTSGSLHANQTLEHANQRTRRKGSKRCQERLALRVAAILKSLPSHF
jgi:hypothetical protein